MFFTGSRYLTTTTYQVPGPNGAPITVTRLPLPSPRPTLGWHQVLGGERLDLIAYQFLNDATDFWVLCDTNGAVVPDALASHALVAIPASS